MSETQILRKISGSSMKRKVAQKKLGKLKNKSLLQENEHVSGLSNENK